MNNFIANIPTEHAGIYMKQLCRHWAHKFPVEFNDQRGSLELPSATCVLDVSTTNLAVELSVKNAADAARMQQVVEEHLQRFGFREKLMFAWHPTA